MKVIHRINCQQHGKQRVFFNQKVNRSVCLKCFCRNAAERKSFDAPSVEIEMVGRGIYQKTLKLEYERHRDGFELIQDDESVRKPSRLLGEDKQRHLIDLGLG